MHYCGINKTDVANGPGFRVSLFVSFCRHRCPECHAKEAWAKESGLPFTEETKDEILEALKPDVISGITLLGGDPFEPENQKELIDLLREIKRSYPEKDIWCFTGYLFEEITGKQKCVLKHNKESIPSDHPRCDVTDEMLSMIDVLVDGEFQKEKRDIALQFRGSSNQRMICVAESLATESIVLWDENNKKGKK